MKKIFLILIFLLFSKPLYAKDTIKIDPNIIAKIESSNGKYMYGAAGEVGWHQITKICLKDYNRFHTKKIKRKELLNKEISGQVCQWYFEKRIPQFLRRYGLTNNLDNILLCYQSGIHNLRKGKIGKKGWDYINKYKKELNKP